MKLLQRRDALRVILSVPACTNETTYILINSVLLLLLLLYGENRLSFLLQLQWASSGESLSVPAVEASPSVMKKKTKTQLASTGTTVPAHLCSPAERKTAPHAHAAPSGDGAVFGSFSRKFPASAGGDPSAGPAMKSQRPSCASPEGENNDIPNSAL